MPKKIVIMGTMDTKGEQLQFLKEQIAGNGFEPIIMDLSMGGRPSIEPDISAEEICRLAGKDFRELAASKDRLFVTNTMNEGARQKAMDLLSREQLHGIVAMGGSTMAFMGSKVMAQLPFGMPKVIATPAAMPVYVGAWFGATDLIVMQMIMEVAGMNDLIKSAISQVAGAITGMVALAADYHSLKLPHPSIAVTEVGFSDQCAKHVETLLTQKGYNVFPFHAQGISDKAMDRLIAQGFFDGVIEIVPAGLIEARFKGNRAADQTRLDAACDRGIPQIWAPCCLNMTGAGPTRHNRDKYIASGKVYHIDDMRAMARFPLDEMLIGAQMYAEKMNRAKGPLKFVVPLKGWSSLDTPGSILYDPDEDLKFVAALKEGLSKPVDIEMVDANLEELSFAEVLVNSLDAMMTSGS